MVKPKFSEYSTSLFKNLKEQFLNPDDFLEMNLEEFDIAIAVGNEAKTFHSALKELAPSHAIQPVMLKAS